MAIVDPLKYIWKLSWTGKGRYWLDNGQASIDMGHCLSKSDAEAAISEIIEAGTGDESWAAWTASKKRGLLTNER